MLGGLVLFICGDSVVKPLAGGLVRRFGPASAATAGPPDPSLLASLPCFPGYGLLMVSMMGMFTPTDRSKAPPTPVDGLRGDPDHRRRVTVWLTVAGCMPSSLVADKGYEFWTP